MVRKIVVLVLFSILLFALALQAIPATEYLTESCHPGSAYYQSLGCNTCSFCKGFKVGISGQLLNYQQNVWIPATQEVFTEWDVEPTLNRVESAIRVYTDCSSQYATCTLGSFGELAHEYDATFATGSKYYSFARYASSDAARFGIYVAPAGCTDCTGGYFGTLDQAGGTTRDQDSCTHNLNNNGLICLKTPDWYGNSFGNSWYSCNWPAWFAQNYNSGGIRSNYHTDATKFDYLCSGDVAAGTGEWLKSTDYKGQIKYSSGADFDSVSNGTSWYYCNANADVPFQSMNGVAMQTNDIVNITAGSYGEHGYLCYLGASRDLGIVPNPSFETQGTSATDAANWAESPYATRFYTTTNPSSKWWDGNAYIIATYGGTGATVSDWINVGSNKKYTLKALLKNNFDTADQAYIDVNDGIDQSGYTAFTDCHATSISGTTTSCDFQTGLYTTQIKIRLVVQNPPAYGSGRFDYIRIMSQKENIAECCGDTTCYSSGDGERKTTGNKIGNYVCTDTEKWQLCTTPATEICDGIDNDCDGYVDENNVCDTTPPSVNFKDITKWGDIRLRDYGSGTYPICRFDGSYTSVYTDAVAACKVPYPNSNNFTKTSDNSVCIYQCGDCCPGLCTSGYVTYTVRYECKTNYPLAGSWQTSDFNVGYNTTDASGLSSCKLWIKDGALAWADKGIVTCGVNQQKTITVGAGKNCTAQGLNSCGVKITATDSSTSANVNDTTIRYFSIDYSSPVIAITSPAAGSLQAADFNVQYSATDAGIGTSVCNLYIKNGATGWSDKGTIPCVGQKIITVGAGKYCSATGTNACGVRIWANDSFNNINSVDTYFSIAYCGNGICESGENCGNCLSDCPSPGTSCSISNSYGTCTGFNNVCSAGTWTCNASTPVAENTIALCNNGIDDNCNGLADAADPACDTTPPSATININNNALNTSSKSVTLYLTYSDTQSGVKNCRYSNDAVTWSAYESCSPTKSWALSTVDGMKTVYYEVQDNDNNVKRVSANILLDTTPPTITFTPNGHDWTTQNISFNISCADLGSGCKSIQYLFQAYNFSSGLYYPTTTPITVSGNFATDNWTCNPGKTCRAKLSVRPVDSLDNGNTYTSEEFKIDMQAPLIGTVSCTYKKTTSCNAEDYVTSGYSVNLSAIANDAGVGVKNISIYLNDSSGKQTLVNSPGTAIAAEKSESKLVASLVIGSYSYMAVATDKLGNSASYSGQDFRIGGDSSKTCSVNKGDICKDYQVCGGSIQPSSDANENLGLYCCVPQGNCINRSSVATCLAQKGVIYDENLYSCPPNSTIPASDTVERNKCCKTPVTAKEQSVNWYDLIGNKLSGAARGDKVKCIGISNEPGYYTIDVTLGTRIINQSVNTLVSSTKRVEVGPIELTETGTYRCEGVFHT